MSSLMDLSTQREPWVLFTRSLDEEIAQEHLVRLFSVSFGKLTWPKSSRHHPRLAPSRRETPPPTHPPLRYPSAGGQGKNS